MEGQNVNSAFRIVTLQKKAIRIINNQPRSSHCESKILKFEDKILINNIIFKSKSIIYNQQYLRIGLSFVLIFTSKIQSHIQLINYLSFHIELTPIEETQLLLGPIKICG